MCVVIVLSYMSAMFVVIVFRHVLNVRYVCCHCLQICLKCPLCLLSLSSDMSYKSAMFVVIVFRHVLYVRYVCCHCLQTFLKCPLCLLSLSSDMSYKSAMFVVIVVRHVLHVRYVCCHCLNCSNNYARFLRLTCPLCLLSLSSDMSYMSAMFVVLEYVYT